MLTNLHKGIFLLLIFFFGTSCNKTKDNQSQNTQNTPYDILLNRALLNGYYFQQNENFGIPRFNTRHMDEKPARLLLKLEWRALRKAILKEGDEREQAIRDALVFRGARREQYASKIADENKFINRTDKVKILGRGELKGSFSFKVNAVSDSAKEAIEKAGGTVEII